MLLVLLAGFAGMSVTFSTGSQSVTQTLLFDLGQVILVGGLVMVVATLGGLLPRRRRRGLAARREGKAAYQAQDGRLQAQMAAYQPSRRRVSIRTGASSRWQASPLRWPMLSATAFAGSTVGPRRFRRRLTRPRATARPQHRRSRLPPRANE